MIYYPWDQISNYLRQKYPNIQALYEAVNRGELLRDPYGNIYENPQYQQPAPMLPLKKLESFRK